MKTGVVNIIKENEGGRKTEGALLRFPSSVFLSPFSALRFYYLDVDLWMHLFVQYDLGSIVA